jgi:uncharacterized membrane protein
MKQERIQLIDALRGLSIILMVAYHAGYDLVYFELIPQGVLYNPLLNFLEPVFAGVFILLAGISCRFSRSNLKRGLVTAACAGAVTLAAWAVGQPIWFGILHLLAACMLLYWLLDKARAAAPFVLAAAFLCAYFGLTVWPVFGASADYFPLLPWGFLFFLGAWAGGPVRDRKLPERFYTLKIPVLPAVGRKTLIIYMLHQPLLFGSAYLLRLAIMPS